MLSRSRSSSAERFMPRLPAIQRRSQPGATVAHGLLSAKYPSTDDLALSLTWHASWVTRPPGETTMLPSLTDFDATVFVIAADPLQRHDRVRSLDAGPLRVEGLASVG